MADQSEQARNTSWKVLGPITETVGGEYWSVISVTNHGDGVRTNKVVAEVYEPDHARLIAEALAMKDMLAACVKGMQDRFNHAEYDREDQYPWNLLEPARAILARIDGGEDA